MEGVESFDFLVVFVHGIVVVKCTVGVDTQEEAVDVAVVGHEDDAAWKARHKTLKSLQVRTHL